MKTVLIYIGLLLIWMFAIFLTITGIYDCDLFFWAAVFPTVMGLGPFMAGISMEHKKYPYDCLAGFVIATIINPIFAVMVNYILAAKGFITYASDAAIFYPLLIVAVGLLISFVLAFDIEYSHSE